MTELADIELRANKARLVLQRSENICVCYIKPTCWRCAALMWLAGSEPPKHMVSDEDRADIAAIAE